MTSLANHHSNSTQANGVVKLLGMGLPKSGKTGSLAALVAKGYKLRVLDFDNLLDILAQVVSRECPQFLDNVEYRCLRDKRKAGADGWAVSGQPKAFPDALKMLDRWKYTAADGTEVDLGPPGEWGPDCILVIDTLSRMSDAAMAWRETMVVRGRDGKFDGRALVGDAQRAVEPVLAGLTSESFATNVIVFAHVDFYEMQDGTEKGFPKAPGKKLAPNIPSYFPNVVLYENVNNKRVIRTTSTPSVDLANAKPFSMSASYPIETGLADIFGQLQSPPNPEKPRQAQAQATTQPATLNIIKK